ncbi:hypothetical protein PIROE2DRAFT_3863 [Piromyces sp. E2]|nr:hypothetical protein PIROE2DRAFT_3863 [Piromyces sp. E2]|eukprot:OUM68418.1 hypothetical protein PIROE2DRAFT_3863 [Piromyces sp. E2]
MSDETNTTDELNFKYVFINILYYINDSLFYAFIIQLILVTYGYFSVGKTTYWRVLYYSSWFGLCGAIIEKLCRAWTEHPDNTNKYVYILYIINEPFWIISEYTIPFRIGIIRYQEKSVFNNKIYRAHGFSFLILAVAELSCTLLILKRLSTDFKIAKRKGHSGGIYQYSRQSSFFILLVIDICGFILAILSLISNYTFKAFLVIFHCLKSNFVLILAFDALIFKIENMEITNSGKQSQKNSSNIFTSTNDNFNEPSNNTKMSTVSVEITPCNIETNIESTTSTNSDDLKKVYKHCQRESSSKLKHYINNAKNIVILESDETNYDGNNDHKNNQKSNINNNIDTLPETNKVKSDDINNKKQVNNNDEENDLTAIYNFSNTIIGNNHEKYNNMRSEFRKFS